MVIHVESGPTVVSVRRTPFLVSVRRTPFLAGRAVCHPLYPDPSAASATYPKGTPAASRSYSPTRGRLVGTFSHRPSLRRRRLGTSRRRPAVRQQLRQTVWRARR